MLPHSEWDCIIFHVQGPCHYPCSRLVSFHPIPLSYGQSHCLAPVQYPMDTTCTIETMNQDPFSATYPRTFYLKRALINGYFSEIIVFKETIYQADLNCVWIIVVAQIAVILHCFHLCIMVGRWSWSITQKYSALQAVHQIGLKPASRALNIGLATVKCWLVRQCSIVSLFVRRTWNQSSWLTTWPS